MWNKGCRSDPIKEMGGWWELERPPQMPIKDKPSLVIHKQFSFSCLRIQALSEESLKIGRSDEVLQVFGQNWRPQKGLSYSLGESYMDLTHSIQQTQSPPYMTTPILTQLPDLLYTQVSFGSSLQRVSHRRSPIPVPPFQDPGPEGLSPHPTSLSC